MTAHAPRGNTLVATLVVLTGLSLMAALTFARVTPRVRMAYQNAAWQEARLAAEAGVDVAMNDLLQQATGMNTGTWEGWQEEPSKTAPAGLLKQLANPNAAAERIAKLLEKIAKKAAKKGPPTPVTATAPIYLDNLKVSTARGVASEVDVRLWGLTAAHTQWYRVRSMGTVALPPRAFEVPANLDGLLRRFNLRSVRPSLRKNDAGAPSSVPLPSISRTVEALIEPVLPWELALWAGGSVELGATGLWNVDSYDSSDPLKSNNGAYPGRGSSLLRTNGSIATNQQRPFEALYGPLLAANGAEVRGAVATNGGDHPDTAEHENVTGALRLQSDRIRSDFAREMPPLERPPFPVALPPPLLGASFLPGPPDDPAVYLVPGSLQQLRITAPAGGTNGAIVIMVNGNLDLEGPLILPPTVTALLYVRGDITFRDSVNAGPWNSNRASQLLIFGEATAPLTQKLQVLGEFSVCAAFYGPRADVAVDGRVHWMGSVSAGSFRVTGGGDGGLHFDEALSLVGPPISYRISRYIEDVRE